jgi:hypothetical protein
LSETFLIVRTNEQDMIKKVYRSLCKVPVYSCQTSLTLDLSS